MNFLKVQPATPGGTASVSVQTTAGASCNLAYRTPAGTPSSAAGLGAKTADASGVAAFSWLIDGDTKPGLGNINVSCGNLSLSDVIQIGDSTLRRLGPGDILLAEDLEGQGHVTREVGPEERISVFAPLPPQA